MQSFTRNYAETGSSRSESGTPNKTFLLSSFPPHHVTSYCTVCFAIHILSYLSTDQYMLGEEQLSCDMIYYLHAWPRSAGDTSHLQYTPQHDPLGQLGSQHPALVNLSTLHWSTSASCTGQPEHSALVNLSILHWSTSAPCTGQRELKALH